MQQTWEMMILGNNIDYTFCGSLVVFLLRFFATKKMKKDGLNRQLMLKSSNTAKK